MVEDLRGCFKTERRIGQFSQELETQQGIIVMGKNSHHGTIIVRI
jgi:hypothetical protein